MATDLDRAHLAAYYASIPNRHDITKGQIADYFAYYLQVEVGRDSVTTAEIRKCFYLSDLGNPTWIAQHLTNNSKGKSATFVKAKVGYRLHANARDRIGGDFGLKSEIIQNSTPLKKIRDALPAGARADFLQECIDSYGVGCTRAPVIMFWLFLMDHLFDLVLSKNLPEFNAVLSKNTDKRVKVSEISKKDDFGEIPEGKFIEFLKSSGIISSDVKKILEQKLGTRNSAAHPSGVKFKQSKANEFFEDLIENVYMKYPL